MALALRGAAALKPEIRLAQALSEYEAILYDDEKASFRTLRAGKPPVPSDVMKLTADIDRDNSQRWGRRCVGPRLTSILESVQQFTTIADIIIGGSQCIIASAIWGTLKTTLQLAVGFSSFFDNLSGLYMQIGRGAPRFQDYGALYSGAPRLQKALCDYFCMVIGVCYRAVLFTRKGFAAQLSNTVLKPFKTEFGPLATQLSELAETIRDEASLASKQELQLERQDASAFRARFSGKSTQEIQAAQKRRWYKKQLRFLDACSSFDNQAPWKRARKAGTSTWILEENAYKEWVEQSTSSVLWCTGKLGCGKTVSTATLVQETIIRYPQASVAHFFCNHDNSESLKAKVIVGTLVRQLLTNADPESFDDINSHDLSTLDEEAMVAYLGRLTLATGRQMFVFVDGLDECEDIELKILLKCLDKMIQSHRHLHVFCSSRPDIAVKFQPLLQPLYQISASEDNPEIAHYIDFALEDCLQSGNLCLGNPALIITIRDKLLQGCQGMFLWVVFQIEALCAESTDDAILHALDSLPRSLPETFQRILKRLDQAKATNSDMRRKIFALVTAAKRSLTTDELREAVSVTPGDTTWDPDKKVNDIQRVVTTNCGSLLLIDEEDMTVRFAHHSVRQYVVSATSTAEEAGPANYLASSSEADLVMGEICITYLNWGVFETQLTKFTGQTLRDSKNITMSIVENTLSSGSIRKMALRLLRNRMTSSIDLASGLQAEMRSYLESIRPKYAFLGYARDFWLIHTTRLDDKVPGIHRPWFRLLDDRVSIVRPPWGPDHWRQLPKGFLEWTIEHEHDALLAVIEHRLNSFPSNSSAHKILLKLFTDRGKIFRGRQGELCCVLLKLSKSSATWKLLAAVIKSHERAGVIWTIAVPSQMQPGQVLQPTKIRDRVDSFETLLEYSPNNEILDGEKRLRVKLMLTAVAEGWLDVVKLLLDGAAIFVDQIEQGIPLRSEILLCAAENGHADIVARILARSGPDVNAKSPDGMTALALAARRPSTTVLQCLLAHKAIDVNAADAKRWTPLHHAAAGGNVEAVKLLLSSKGIRPTLQDPYGRTAADVAKGFKPTDPHLRERLDELCHPSSELQEGEEYWN